MSVEEKLASLEAKARAATPGPWVYSKTLIHVMTEQGGYICEMAEGSTITDGPFIADSDPTTVLALVAIARAAFAFQDDPEDWDRFTRLERALSALEDKETP